MRSIRGSGCVFTFAYTAGMESAKKTGRFEALPVFKDIYAAYESDSLFPIFSNRVLNKSRPEYQDLLQWLCMPEDDRDPVAILARTGGPRATDTFEVFPRPEKAEDGTYRIHFLVHGLSHMPPEAMARAETLSPGDPLLIMRDVQNPFDRTALALRTSEQSAGDMHLVGYCPRYLREDLVALMDEGVSPKVTVVRVNPAPAPVQFRLLCRVEAHWPAGFEPFSGYEYKLLAAGRNANDLVEVR